jgi:hypothetical protein
LKLLVSRRILVNNSQSTDLSQQLAKNPNNTQYQKAPTFTVSCESLEHNTYRKGAPL